MSGFILRIVCAYTKTRVARLKVVYESGKAKSGSILNLVTVKVMPERILELDRQCQ